jgi:hypothetical protein
MCRVGARDEGKREERKEKGSRKWASPPFYTIMRGVGGGVPEDHQDQDRQDQDLSRFGWERTVVW